MVLTYDRIDSLFFLIRKLSFVPSLSMILVIWNNPRIPLPESKIHKIFIFQNFILKKNKKKREQYVKFTNLKKKLNDEGTDLGKKRYLFLSFLKSGTFFICFFENKVYKCTFF